MNTIKTIHLSRIIKVSPREIWKHEALHFTQWLAKPENIVILCEELQLNLENIQAEAKAGKYSVDIIADDIDSKRKVIIENQLESTDHKHLGQLLTYASAYDAAIIIWLVTDYNDEHRQAIDWFNRNISEGISFFLVQIEIYRIDNSSPAPKFSIICEPNDWGKIVKTSPNNNTQSATKLLQNDFWTQLKEYCLSINAPINMGRSPKPHHWYNIAIGSSQYQIALTINTVKNYVGCEIYIRDNKLLYEKFHQNKSAIESIIGERLEWMELPEGTASRILLTHSANIKDRNNWIQHFDWIINTVQKFSLAFRQYDKA